MMCASASAFPTSVGVVAPIVPVTGTVAAIAKMTDRLNIVAFELGVSGEESSFERIEKPLALVFEKSGVRRGEKAFEQQSHRRTSVPTRQREFNLGGGSCCQ